jgi:glycerate 2-kinase
MMTNKIVLSHHAHTELFSRSYEVMTLFNDAQAIWWAGTQAVQPDTLFEHWITCQDRVVPSAIYMLAIGKAACAMALAVVNRVTVANGLVITKHHHALEVPQCHVMTADHPVTGHASVLAAEAVKTFAMHCRTHPDIPVWVLLSGGASALVGDIPHSISMEDWQWLNHAMLANGLTITEINDCRRALGTLKGGKLLEQLAPATVTTLAISDVIGDDPAIIGSGPTVIAPPLTDNVNRLLHTLFPTTCPQQYRLEPIIKQAFATPVPLPDSRANTAYHILGSARVAVDQAAKTAQAKGYKTQIITNPMQADVCQEAQRIVSALKQPVTEPTCLIFWGEPTVQLPPDAGLGGRNQHLALTVAQCMDTATSMRWHVLAGGTDGTDGPTPAAGGWVDNCTEQKARQLHVDIEHALHTANTYMALQTLHQLWITGPTQTNVMDLVIALRQP